MSVDRSMLIWRMEILDRKGKDNTFHKQVVLTTAAHTIHRRRMHFERWVLRTLARGIAYTKA